MKDATDAWHLPGSYTSLVEQLPKPQHTDDPEMDLTSSEVSEKGKNGEQMYKKRMRREWISRGREEEEENRWE